MLDVSFSQYSISMPFSPCMSENDNGVGKQLLLVHVSASGCITFISWMHRYKEKYNKNTEKIEKNSFKH